MEIIFIITTIACGVGWLNRYVSTAAMIYYLEKKGYTAPNDEEIRECTRWVIMRLLKK